MGVMITRHALVMGTAVLCVMHAKTWVCVVHGEIPCPQQIGKGQMRMHPALSDITIKYQSKDCQTGLKRMEP